MKKIITSIILIGLLLSIVPFVTVGEVNIYEEHLDGSEQLFLQESDDGQLKLPEFVPGKLIVKFKEYVQINLESVKGTLYTGIESIDNINNRNGGLKSAELVFENGVVYSLSNVYKFSFSSNVDILNLIKDYSSESSVVYAEPNYMYTTSYRKLDIPKKFPNDPLFNQQWALNQLNDCDIDAPEAWSIETGDHNVVIAVIDTGVDYDHPDLSNNILRYETGFIHGYDFVNNDNDPMDDNGHGTHCCGIAAAVTNNSIGIAGVCWNCKIMPVKGFDSSGSGKLDVLANCLVYAADNGADIISMSWGGWGYSQLLHDAIRYAYVQGLILVASAGNNGYDVDKHPAGYNEVISVAATDESDELSSYSNYGIWVDVAAPGDNILSTFPDNTYEEKSGTSMACPHVAGIIALLVSKNPGFNQKIIKTIISNIGDAIDSDKYVGAGRTNAFKVLQAESAIALLDYVEYWRDNVKGLVNINGTIWSSDLQYFVLKYGRGKNPDSWITLLNSSTSQSGVLASLDTTELDEGFYTINLRVVFNGKAYQDTLWICVNNIHNRVYVDGTNTEGPWDGTLEHPYQRIQDGIDDAGRYDDVYVLNGIYNEFVLLYRLVNLIGEDKENTVIDNQQKNSIAVYVWHNDGYCSIEEFTVRNSSDDHARNSGIYIYCSDNILISNCIIYNNQNGINLHYSSHCIFKNNLITKCGNGIYLYRSAHYNIISYNDISRCSVCVFLFNWNSYNEISNNNIYSTGDSATSVSIWLEYECNYNLIYHNNIMCHLGRPEAVRGDNLRIREDYCSNNTFYNETLKEGNYWDDYPGDDIYGDGVEENDGGDGIGDTPYFGDNYPLITAIGIQSDPPSKPFIDGPIDGKTREHYTYTVSSTDPNGDIIRYFFDWGDGRASWLEISWTMGFYPSGKTIETEHAWRDEGTYEIRVKTRDIYGYESEWSDPLVVTVPRNRVMNRPLLHFLQNHPLLYQLSQLFLQRLGL